MEQGTATTPLGQLNFGKGVKKLQESMSNLQSDMLICSLLNTGESYFSQVFDTGLFCVWDCLFTIYLRKVLQGPSERKAA